MAPPPETPEQKSLRLKKEAHELAVLERQDAKDRHDHLVAEGGELKKIVAAREAIAQAVIAEQTAELRLFELQKKQAVTGSALEASLQAQIDLRRTLIQELKDEREEEEKLAEAQLALASTGEALAQTIFGTNNSLVSFGSNIAKASKQGRGFSGALSDMVAGFKDAAGQADLFAVAGAQVMKVDELLTAGVVGFVSATLKLIQAQDEAVSSFMKSTGAGMEYSRVITESQRETAIYGIEAAEAGKSVEALYTGMSQFTELSKGEQKNITKTVSLLSELGVSAGTSAKILDTATRSLGMNANQSEELLRDIKATADAIGLPAGKLAEDFASAAPKLTKYGGDMMEVFEGLAAQAKATGIEINQLLGFTEQFDTFEGAGKAVGRLNAILGGPYLNSIDMLNATDEERIEILQRLTDQAGLQFDQLGRYEQMAIAQAMGTDVDTARRMFGASRAEFEKQALAQEELAEQTAKAQTIMDQLKAAFNALLVDMRPFIEEAILPIIYGLRDMATSSGALREELGKLYTRIQSFMTGFGALLFIGGLIATLSGFGAGIGIPMMFSGAKMLAVGFVMSKGAEYGGKASVAAQAKIAAAKAAGGERAKRSGQVQELASAAGKPPPSFAAGGVMSTMSMLALGIGTAGLGARDAHSRGYTNPMLYGAHLLTGTLRPKGAVGVVGENGPELTEEPIGTRVSPAGTTERLTKALENVSSKLDRMAAQPSDAGRPLYANLTVDGRRFAEFVGEALDHPVNRDVLMANT